MNVRVALNGRFSGALQPTGTQTAAFGCFDAILRAQHGRTFVLFADERHPGVSSWKGLKGLEIRHVPFRDWGRIRSHLWEQFVLPVLARSAGCSIIHSPMTTCPAFSLGLRTLVTLCDVHYVTHPEWFSPIFRISYKLLATLGLRRADRVVCISDYVRKEAIRELQIDPKVVRTIYLGIKKFPHSEEPISRRDVVLCVGSLQPHKNLRGAIEAFRILMDRHPTLELRVVGNPQAGFSSIPDLADLLETPRVKPTGYLDDAALASEYREASVFCYPSFEEGFGLPLVEAMHHGTPIVTSSVSCLPEIGGEEAILVNPSSATDIANGIEIALNLNESERRIKAQKMSEWITRYQWPAIADAYHSVYDELDKL